MSDCPPDESLRPGEVLKPFVFLDLFEADMRALAGSMPVHPHSGIARVTVFADGDVFNRIQASWTASSASLTDPSMRYATART